MLRSWSKGVEVGITASAFGLKLRDGSFKQVPWSVDVMVAGVRTLAAEMSGINGTAGKVSLVLSNHFMRYLVLPWNDALGADAEWLAYARHQLAALYGVDAQQYQIRIARQPFGKPQMVAALETKVLDDLMKAFEAASLQVQSIQPHLMAVFNVSRKQLIEDNFWLAVLESGRVCVAKFNDGAWSYVGMRALDIGDEAAYGLHKVMIREMARVPDDLANSHIYVHAPALGQPLMPWDGVKFSTFSFSETAQVAAMRHFGMVF